MKILRLILRLTSILILCISTVWFIIQPSFDSVLAILGAIATLIGSFIDYPLSPQALHKPQPPVRPVPAREPVLPPIANPQVKTSPKKFWQRVEDAAIYASFSLFFVWGIDHLAYGLFSLGYINNVAAEMLGGALGGIIGGLGIGGEIGSPVNEERNKIIGGFVGLFMGSVLGLIIGGIGEIRWMIGIYGLGIGTGFIYSLLQKYWNIH